LKINSSNNIREDSGDMDVNSKLKMRFSAGSPFWISRFHCISAWLTKNDGKSLPDKVVQRIVKKLQDCKVGCGGLQRIYFETVLHCLFRLGWSTCN
jgi:hypothetical protein